MGIFKFSFTNLVLVAFLGYFLNCIYVIYHLFYVPNCIGSNQVCLRRKFGPQTFRKMQISIYTSSSATFSINGMDLLFKNDSFQIEEYGKYLVNATLPNETKNNGSLYAHVFLHKASESPFNTRDRSTYALGKLTRFGIPSGKKFNLITDKMSESASKPVTHIYHKLVLYTVTNNVSFERMAIPGDIFHLIKFSRDGSYLPLLYIDGLSTLQRHSSEVNVSMETVPLVIEHYPVTIGRLRIWASVEQTLQRMKGFGFSDKDVDEIKGIFTDTNLYFLAVTFFISLLHALFDFLAFKNDISYWRQKRTMVGMSSRTVLWRCFSTAIIFLYLMDEKTSLLVLVPAGIGTVIEIWKVFKALKINISWSGIRPSVHFGEKSDTEKETEEYDSQAMTYLSYPLYPLVIIGAIYSLVYHPQKSWYSWVITSLVNGIYIFGFLFMLPQLFVNYKLKSVAHLPWRAFMYKAFNTFIDDVFAFIITMPTAHRLACFRDDFVFVIYLYQRWLYPVDKSRVNEFGVSYDDDSSDTKNVAENETDNAVETKKTQ